MTTAASKPALAGDYWTQSARPLVSLAFVAPMLVLYELGVVSLGAAAVRNGADVWLRQLLELAGFGQYFLLPLLTCGLLLAWHHATHQPWRVQNRTIRFMWIESAAIGLGLLVLAQVQAAVIGHLSPVSMAASTSTADTLAARMVGYLGAGIYEELLFRLLLLPAVALGLRGTGLNQRASWTLAIVATSLIFAAAHYQFEFNLLGWELSMPHGDEFDWYSFIFRFSAGALFGAVFAIRGFGIAVGSHAVYDLIVALS